MQFVRERGWRDCVFLRIIKPAAMNRPQLSGYPFFGGLGVGFGRIEAVIEPDEIEGGANPGDAGDDMQPAQHHAKKLDQVCFHAVEISSEEGRSVPRRTVYI